jgi:hypothetical protein
MDATETHEADGYCEYEDLWKEDRVGRGGKTSRRRYRRVPGVPSWKRKH